MNKPECPGNAGALSHVISDISVLEYISVRISNIDTVKANWADD